ncbi:hypothetical protein OEZ86_008934 [Tetradesmus obliquus]|uniref:NTF2 domain-containing protein n=1 Tax=Tetradesmus obliquus TaxID=3088 RepID=A0ABY8ULZ1_TETOB|nr:hypothetical protein OEZ85_000505 [Tetradesmus obliquus]WIA41569.1 hypothetical protein OEZ86_008934 [Tetradesmus obliquus]
MANVGGSSTGPGPKPDAAWVANEFVKRYYEVLAKHPKYLNRFYKEESQFTLVLRNHGGVETRTTVSTTQDIQEKVNSTVQGAKITIEHSEAQYSLQSGVLLQVDGRLVLPNEAAERRYTQIFFLAPQDKGFFVLNDILTTRDELQSVFGVYGPIAHILVIPSRTHDTNTAYVDFESEVAAQKALADYQKRSLILGGTPASVLPKIPKVQRLAAGMGGRGDGRGGGRGGGEFRRSGSTGAFGGRPGGYAEGGRGKPRGEGRGEGRGMDGSRSGSGGGGSSSGPSGGMGGGPSRLGEGGRGGRGGPRGGGRSGGRGESDGRA